MGEERELRHASDAFLARVERLHRLEEEKRALTPGTPETIKLAREIENLSADVLEWARRETELAELAGKRQPTNLRPIAVIPPREIHEVLRDWREAEQVLSEQQPGSPSWEGARADVERLRDEYRRALRERTE